MAKNSGKAGSLFWGLSLDTNEWKKNIKAARKDLKKFGDWTKKGLDDIAGGLKLASAGFLATSSGLLLFSKNVTENINSQKILADSIGTTQSKIAGLELATEAWGAETSMVIDKMREVGGFDAFAKMADEVKNAGDEQAQLNKARELFGNEGTKFLAVLQQGSAGLAFFEQKALSLGQALSPEKVKMSTLAWGEFEAVWMRLQGLGTRIGATFAKPFAKISNTFNAFLQTFDGEILGFFQNISDKLVSIINGGINLFSKLGIPAINSFISFANSMGEAFDNLFSFLEPAANSVFGTMGSWFQTMLDFLATIKESIGIGITKAIQIAITSSFNGLAKLSGFINDLLGPIMTGLSEAGILSEEFSMGFVEAMEDQRIELRRLGKELANPFKEAEQQFFNDMVNKMTAIENKNDRDRARFKAVTNKLDLEIKDIESGNFGNQNKNNATGPVSENFKKQNIATNAFAGSLEAFQIENSNNPTVKVQKETLSEIKKLRKEIKNLGSF